MTEGNDKLSNRLNIEILPVLSHQDFPTQLFVRNSSPQKRSIRRALK